VIRVGAEQMIRTADPFPSLTGRRLVGDLGTRVGMRQPHRGAHHGTRPMEPTSGIEALRDIAAAVRSPFSRNGVAQHLELDGCPVNLAAMMIARKPRMRLQRSVQALLHEPRLHGTGRGGTPDVPGTGGSRAASAHPGTRLVVGLRARSRLGRRHRPGSSARTTGRTRSRRASGQSGSHARPVPADRPEPRSAVRRTGRANRCVPFPARQRAGRSLRSSSVRGQCPEW
jgi:hypothetical protein